MSNYEKLNIIKYTAMVNNNKIHLKKLEKPANIMKVLAHPVRIAIIKILMLHEKMSVTEIFEMLSIQQAAASNHLKLMKTYNLVNSKRAGKNTYYSAEIKTIEILGQEFNFVYKGSKKINQDL